MIINGLGFSDRTISLTPQFFQGKVLDILICEDGTPKREAKPQAGWLIQYGGGYRDRTGDPLHAMQVLSQLS
jgi:hypothetical protein